MDYKKGFTLIELIGVVVILGILMLLVFPSVMNNIRGTKGQISSATKEVVLKATELYVDQNKNYYSTYNGSVYCITIAELLEKGIISEQVVDAIDHQMVVSVKTINKGTVYDLVQSNECIATVTNHWVKADINIHGTDGASVPELEDNMIPIKYWADRDTDYTWYDYNNKIWANAVVVRDSSRERYLNAPVGTEINEEDILAYFVWIPRFRYQLWNVEGIDSKARTIAVEFENSGTTISTGSTNGTWLTHPAFCVGRTGDPTVSVGNYGTNRSSCSGTEVNGFWVGKFEPSIGSVNTVNEVKNMGVVIKPNQVSLTNQDSLKQFQTAWSLTTQYQLNSQYVTRVIRNSEWGAVAYLTNSKYGIAKQLRFNNTTIASVGITDTDDKAVNPSVTGCAYKNTEDVAYGAKTCDTGNSVGYDNLAIGVQASTTGNIYGIYDMAGGSMDRMAATKLPSTGEEVVEEFAFYGNVDEKYYDLYAYNRNKYNYVIGRLGDATKELCDVTNATAPVCWYGNVGSSYTLQAALTDVFIRGRGYYRNSTMLYSQFADVTFFGQHDAQNFNYRDTFRVVMNKE